MGTAGAASRPVLMRRLTRGKFSRVSPVQPTPKGTGRRQPQATRNASSHSKSTTTTRFPVAGHRQPRWLFLLYAQTVPLFLLYAVELRLRDKDLSRHYSLQCSPTHACNNAREDDI